MQYRGLKNNKKKVVLVLTFFVICMAVVVNVSLAKFKMTESINIAKGTINYASSDLNVMAIYVEADSGYTLSDAIPESDYVLNEEKSYCKLDDTELDVTITYDMSTKTLIIAPITSKGTKCYLYFDIVKTFTVQDVIASKTIGTRTDFSVTFSSDTTGIVYTAPDNDGTSYYFAGAPTDNYVKFGKWATDTSDVYRGFSDGDATYKDFNTLSECESNTSYSNCTSISYAGKDMYWRIIRVNGDGTIRMIYAGTSAIVNGTSSSETQIGTSQFSSGYNDNMYVGYMYTEGKGHGTATSSVIKGVLENWYSSNLNNYTDYISYDAGFCGDRTAYTNSVGTASGEGTGSTKTYYAPYVRLITNKSPVLTCTESTDLYTTSSSSKGNKALTYPIGLITADEIYFAGGVYGSSYPNKSYYLYTGYYYWTMSPRNYSSAYSGYEFLMSADGSILDSGGRTDNTNGVQPVINLKADVLFTGSGTTTDPYVVS